MDWPSRIRKLLQKRDWTQAELARRMGVSRRTVEHWIAGAGEPLGPAQLLLRMLEAGAELQPA